LQYLVKTHPGKDHGSFTEIKVPVTHQLIANMAGLSRETASTTIKEFEESTVLKQKSEFMLVSESKLASNSDD
jgi:CRP-like cAMP-binding protein